jgi:hypothetical protein
LVTTAVALPRAKRTSARLDRLSEARCPMPSPANPNARAVDAPPRRAARDAEGAPRARTPIPTGAIVIAAIVFVAVATHARPQMRHDARCCG